MKSLMTIAIARGGGAHVRARLDFKQYWNSGGCRLLRNVRHNGMPAGSYKLVSIMQRLRNPVAGGMLS